MEHEFCFAGGALPPHNKTYLMGILNYTPDSFSDGALYFTPEKAALQAERMAEEGADLIDLGCCSTRPGAETASEAEELRRLREALPAVRRAVTLPISVDTFRPAIAREALALGAQILNDVSGRFSPGTAALVRETGAGWILMHTGNGPDSGAVCDYPDGVVAAVQRFFDEARASALAAGVRPEQLCFDPGFGFGKDEAQNIELLRGLDRLDTHGAALLAALSRKRFVGAISGESAPGDRAGGTLAAGLAALSKGADILRVHDVALHAAAVRATDRILRG